MKNWLFAPVLIRFEYEKLLFVLGNKVVLSHFSPNGNEGYPGDMVAFVTYELTSSNEFRVDFKAYSTKMTICNLTNSIHFNLAGHNAGPDEMGKHDITINADCVTVTNAESLPTGEIKSVYNTMYDFQIPIKVGTLLDKYDGMDTNFCINRGVEQGNCFVTRLIHPESGRILEIYSNQSGLQFETGNNFPLRAEPAQSKAKNAYLKNGVQTFELLDEIYNRIAEVISADKSPKYNELLKFIRELQKKDGTLYRTNSGSSIASRNAEKGIKRNKVSLETLGCINLTPFQLKYVERILEKIVGVPEPNNLNELQDTLSKVTKTCKSKENDNIISIKLPGHERNEETTFLKDVRGKKGARYTKHGAVRVMTQNYPDACNNINFPCCILKPGCVYHHSVVYKFLVKSSNIGIVGYL